MRPSRRHFLHGFLAGTLGLPWLEAFAPKSAFAQSPARRFIVMFSPNGTIRESWVPTGTETSFELSAILSPLAPHQSDLIVIDGVDQKGAGGDGHQNGIGGMLTGAGLLSGPFPGQGSAPAGWAEGPSVDQRIADLLSDGMPFRSLELGVQTGSADNFGRMCYRARNRPLSPRDDPGVVFDDVFGAALLSPEQRESRRAHRTSILDYVRSELSELGSRVGAADRERLEMHLGYLREVEQRLERSGESLSACALPARPGPFAAGTEGYAAIGEAQLDLMVLALACNQTRVASLQWSRSVSDVRFTWLGISESHHALSHRADSDSDARDKLTRINRWYAERLAGLIERLRRYPEGSGTLFDQCAVLWCNELGKGNTHSRDDAPYVLAGGAGGALRTGRWLRFTGDVPHNNLLLSLINAMGLPDPSFGRPEWCTGPLPGLL